MVNNILTITDSLKILSHSEPDRPNIGYIEGSEGFCLIDAGSSDAHAQLIRQMISDSFTNSDKYLVLTHWHWDHTFGLASFNDCISIAHFNLIPKMKWYKSLSWSDEALDKRVSDGEELSFIRDCLKQELPDRTKLEIKIPKIHYNSKMSINLGNKDLEVFHVNSDHTNDNSIVYSSEDRCLFIGDCLYSDIYHNDHYTISKFFPLIEKLKTYKVSTLVDSHKDVLRNEQCAAYIDSLLEIGLIAESSGSLEQAKNQLIKKTLPFLDEWKYEIADNFLKKM